MNEPNTPSVHPTIKKCMLHLDILGADDKIKQIVYMYMEGLKKKLKNNRKHKYWRRDGQKYMI